jgi:DNA-binding response OmpR family regulator
MAEPLRVLVVEDHAAFGRFVAALLEGAGWAVVGPVGEPGAALEMARRLPLDAALIDWMLQGEEAFAIAEALAGRDIGCVLMSGHPRSSLPERFRDLPFLEKPFAMEALFAALGAAAARRC